MISIFDVLIDYMWWLWIIKIIFFLLFLFVAHSLWDSLKNKMSTPKTKDLVNIQTNKYRTIIDELTHSLEHEKNKHQNESSVSTLIVHEPSSVATPQDSLSLSMDHQLELQMDLEQLMFDMS